MRMRTDKFNNIIIDLNCRRNALVAVGHARLLPLPSRVPRPGPSSISIAIETHFPSPGFYRFIRNHFVIGDAKRRRVRNLSSSSD